VKAGMFIQKQLMTGKMSGCCRQLKNDFCNIHSADEVCLSVCIVVGVLIFCGYPCYGGVQFEDYVT
jgi:hypothetical protein